VETSYYLDGRKEFAKKEEEEKDYFFDRK